MFTNLIESGSNRREFKRRGSFFLITVAAYAVILFAAGIASIYAYDAQLEAQTSSLELLNWVPPVTPASTSPRENHAPTVRRSAPTNAPVDPHITTSERTALVPPTNDPRLIPADISTKGTEIPPSIGIVRLTGRNADPPSLPSGNSSCFTCNEGESGVRVETVTPPPPPKAEPPKPTTEKVPSVVLRSKAVSLPQPPYPAMAKQTHIQGPVNIQILVDEQGKVISAQVVSGNPMLTFAARDAAMRARFTPTTLNGVPVKIQGVITYNFVLQ